MDKIIFNEIKELYYSFDITNNLYEKGSIQQSINYLYYIMPSNISINKMRNIINNKMANISDYYRDFLINRSDMIDLFMNNNNSFFNNNILRVNRVINYSNRKLNNLNENDISYILESFFKSLDKKIYLHYNNIISENRIIFGNSNNIMFTSLYDSSSVIFIKKLENLYDIMVLVHEIGHSYYYNINDSRLLDRCDILVELKDEIPATIIELKFIKYLRDCGLIEQSYFLQNEYFKLMCECDRKRGNYNYLKYLIAFDISEKIIEKDFNITNYFKHIHKKNIYTLIEELSNEKKKRKVLRK